MIYTPENIVKPFWAENSGFTGGRDALGIQNSSITLYSRLLPGLTNLTERIRYYSFYCWLLNVYAEQYKDEYLAHHYNFFRRAELIIAYLMTNIDNAQQSVVGILYARQHKDDLDENGYYNIKAGADKLGIVPIPKQGETYWGYDSGALGQYYVGSLVNLDLAEIRGEIKEKYFYITDKGKRLAKAFEASIPVAERDYFVNLIEKGMITLEDIDRITSFHIGHIPFKSKEWNCLKELLIEDDGINFRIDSETPSTKRRETIELYLKFKNSPTDITFFPQWAFENISLGMETDTAAFGWYYYYINECVHTALQSIFWVFLKNLEGRIVVGQSYIRELKEMVLSESSEEFNARDTLTDILAYIQSLPIPQKLYELNEANKNGRLEVSLVKSIELLFTIYKETFDYQSQINQFEKSHGIDLQPGHFTENMITFISDKLNYSYEKFIESIIKGIMSKHISSAYRKMGNGESHLLKFMIEDNLFCHVENVFPRPTTPRIKTLDNFLKDLGLLNQDGKITPDGIELYRELQ